MSDLDKLLSNTEKAAGRDTEISRILTCHAEDAFAILGLDPRYLDGLDVTVKKVFRQKSLLIHPDKTDNKDAPEAFGRLKKAQGVITVETDGSGESGNQKRQKLIDIYNHVYTQDPTAEVGKIRQLVAAILERESQDAEEEVKKQKQQEAKEHEESESKKQQFEARKKFETKWEDQRDDRVNNWRSFNKVEKKKKKPKKKVLA